MTESAPSDLAGLARLYGRSVFQAAYRVLGDAGQAEDVQQDVFLQLLQKPVEGVRSWPAYLTASAVRLAIDRLRRRQRWRRLVPRWLAVQPAATDSTEADAIRAERARRLRAALVTLQPREATCFTLRHIEGLDTAAIAQATGMTANHVGVCLHRAVRTLEAQLSDVHSVPAEEMPR